MRRNGVVLLVEDNPDDIELSRIAFQGSPVVKALVVVRDGIEALEYLFAEGRYAGRDPLALPEVVLLDLHMSKVDGHGVLRRLRQDERTRSIPVVVTTTSDEDFDIWRSYELGANSFVRKPADFDQFVETVHRVASYWLVINEPAR